jgi:predicted CXXCH cytochrome family protein
MADQPSSPLFQPLDFLLLRPIQWLVVGTGRHPTWVLSLLAAVVSLGWGSWSVWRGQYTMHSPGPVVLAHEKLDCAACHTRPWQPLERLVAEDQRQVRLVMDQACVVCHSQLVHHSNEIPADVPNCVSCHREHQGPYGLSRVADNSCSGCHADLKTVQGPSAKFAHHIIALATHPEFGVLRRGEPDPGVVLFNHAAHLAPEGIRDAEDRLVVLKCASCHQPTTDGRYMEPVRFASHCASCHASALVYDVERFPGRPAPHGQLPDVLRGVLRERYTDYIQQHPRELGIAKPVERPLPGLSGLREVTKEEWKWVHQRVEQAERILFLGAGGCQYCHCVEATKQGWQLTPPGLPQRWFTCSKFNHFSHRLNPKPVQGEENCTACHEGARSSTKTADVLLPSIQNCRECHNHESLPQNGRTDCVECHTYHNQVGGRRKAD